MVDISNYVKELSVVLTDKAYEASDSLGRIGSEEVVKAMIALLNHPNAESRYMAARTLNLVENNSDALEPLFVAILAKENKEQVGDLVAALEGFDVSSKFVELFKIFLNGSFKASLVAKDLLDHKDFDITERVIKKASKHWDHYSNNVKIDEIFEIKKKEVEEMLNDLKEYLEK